MGFIRKKYKRSPYMEGVMAAEEEYKLTIAVSCEIRGIEEEESLTAHDKLDMIDHIEQFTSYDLMYKGQEYVNGMVDFFNQSRDAIKDGLK